MENENQIFVYNYSASQQEEVKKIREKYLYKEESKMDQLRRLDESTTKKGLACSLVLGTAGSLVLGLGMCCTMLLQASLFIPGVILGLIGIVGVILAYPLSRYLTQKEQERLAPEILKLINELMSGQA